MHVERVGIVVVDDLSHLDPGRFWMTMAARSWTRPFDGQGERRPFDRMPANGLALEDDPFRSLAGALRRRGVYAKTGVPHADFAWADFLRRRIRSTNLVHDFEATVDEAETLIRAWPKALCLPGLRAIEGIGHATVPATPGAFPDPSGETDRASAWEASCKC
jgi:hypothetical protein